MPQVDVLIQNVSQQCIPNLVALQTFKPKKVIWISTLEMKDTLNRLQKAAGAYAQEVWEVDARNTDSLTTVLKQGFGRLVTKGEVVYHLTSGTKSMAVQGIVQLAMFTKQKGVTVRGVVMDPRSQHFDTVFPQAENNSIGCETLSFNQILSVHGSSRKDNSGRAMKGLKQFYEPLQELRSINAALTSSLKGRVVCNVKEASREGFYLRGKGGLPDIVHRALYLAQDVGVIENLNINGNHFLFDSIHVKSPIAYIRNMWMEDWVGCVLAKDDDEWCGGYSSIQVSIQKREDFQEFDFLGARKNHLVYWSCKNTPNKMDTSQLFEVDALRDEVGGSDFHVAGLVHTAVAELGMREKAKRLGVKLVNVLDADAEDKITDISCQ